MVFIIHQQHRFTNCSILQRDTAGKPGAAINNFALHALFLKRFIVQSKQVAESIIANGKNLKTHDVLREVEEHIS
jgi:hypothetical protein